VKRWPIRSRLAVWTAFFLTVELIVFGIGSGWAIYNEQLEAFREIRGQPSSPIVIRKEAAELVFNLTSAYLTALPAAALFAAFGVWWITRKSLKPLQDVADAADGTQEVFLKAFRGIRSFRQGSSLKTWLYRIAIREALNHKRWFKRHLQKNVSIDAEPEEGHAAIEIEDLAATPFEQFAAHEIQTAVQTALQEIPEVFRSAVILRDLEGLSYEEIAEVLECSAGTVKSRILRGRRALKELLEPLLVDHSTLSATHDLSASPNAEGTSAVAHGNDRTAATYSNGSANVGARSSASSSASRAGSSRMPRPAFAPHFGPHPNTISARSRFARESSASEELP